MHPQTCAECSTEFDPTDKFCRECGARRAPETCEACDTALLPEARFCIQCGAPVAGAAPRADAEALARRGTHELGDRRIVTVMFTELIGLASMTERLDPEEISDIVNQFFAVLTEPIYRHGGIVDKYIGDSVVMSIFGVPTVRADDPERAVSAAWAMLQAAREFADALEPRIGVRLAIRCGLNTGMVVAGEVGGAQKRDFTVMGDTVNLAQRMEANASPGGILVASETYECSRHAFDYRVLDPIKVKGKELPVAVFEVAGPKLAEAEVHS
ncbi:zinc ribbon domain-containing protein [bacterium]|nr:zinc ribbon domain-containing protein [bacterium]